MSEHVPLGDCIFCKESDFLLCQAALALQDIIDNAKAHPNRNPDIFLDSGIEVKQWAAAKKCPYVRTLEDISKTG